MCAHTMNSNDYNTHKDSSVCKPNDNNTMKRGGSSSKRNNDASYVASSRRSRASKDKVNSVGDYIRSVMHQLSSSSPPSLLLQAVSPSSTHELGFGQITNTSSAASPLSVRSTRASKSSASSADKPSEQQVWLMIVEKMREEIIRARDIHRADLHQSKRSKRKRASFDPSPNNAGDQQKNAEDAKQYCSVCVAQQSPATAVTVCGHSLCWACLCKWHHRDATSCLTASKKECPCCKKILTKSQVTFIGEKIEGPSSDPSCKDNTTISLATDQRDKLLEAAALPVLSSTLHLKIHDMQSPSMKNYNGLMSSSKPLESSNYGTFDTTAIITSSEPHACSDYSSSLEPYSSVDRDYMRTYIGDQMCSSSGYTQYQSYAATDDQRMSNDFMQQDTLSGSHVFNKQDNEGPQLGMSFQLADQGVGLGLPSGASMVASERDDCVYQPLPAAFMMGNNYNQLPMTTQNADIINDCSWPLVNSTYDQALPYHMYNADAAAKSLSEYNQAGPLLNAYHESEFPDMNSMSSVGGYYDSYMQTLVDDAGAYDSYMKTLPEDVGSNDSYRKAYAEEEYSAMVEQYIARVLEIEGNDGAFTEAEIQELRQLQETLKLQLATSQPLNLQSSSWLSTLVASTSSSTPHASTGFPYSLQYEEMPTNILQNALCENSMYVSQQLQPEENIINNVGYSSHIPEQLGATRNFSSESTCSSSSPLSSSPNNHHYNTPSSATGPHDVALSDWRSVFDDAVWDWSFNDGFSTL